MSPVPVGTSPEADRSTVAVRRRAALDRIQAAGILPVVNPSRNPWVVPTVRRGPAFWFLAAFAATTALVLFWFFGADTSGGFIYAGF